MNYQLGLGYYESHFQPLKDDHITMIDPSPGYLLLPEVPGRIKTAYGDQLVSVNR